MTLYKFSLFLIAFIITIFGCTNKNKSDAEFVTLKAFNGKYVGLAAKNIGLKLIANKDSVGEWERFVIIRKQGNIINFKMLDHLYVSADYSLPGEYLIADKLQASDWETFTIENLWNNVIALKASNGKYVSVDPTTNLLTPNKVQIGDSEKFTMERNK